MTLFHLLVVLLALGGVAAVAAGKVRGGLPAPTSSRPEVELPQPAGPRDIDRLRFSVGFRGYRMDEVDEVLDRLSAELAARDEELSQLRHHVYGGPAPATEPDLEPGLEPEPPVAG